MSYDVDRIRYGLQLLDDETVKTSVAHMESHGIWFGWPLNGEVAHIINSADSRECVHSLDPQSRGNWESNDGCVGTNGANSTGEWDELLTSMARVKRSTRLLAWYLLQ